LDALRDILNGNNAMRDTETGGWMVRGSSRAPMHALRIGAIALGATFLVVTAGPARAGDDDTTTDQRSFSERFVDGFKSTIRGTSMDNRGIDYRERSPLVVPPTLDLPPPAAAAAAAPKVANWPKDPDERQRKAIIAAKKKNAPPVAVVAAPGAAVATAAEPARPVNIAPPVVEQPTPLRSANGPETAKIDPVYDQPGNIVTGGTEAVSSSLGSFGIGDLGLGNLFGTKKVEQPTVVPGTEPTREALTQPPSGYQSPSPNYPYAVAKKGFFEGESNPDRNPAAQMSSASSVVH
jgi:hypothetical protein